MAAKDRLSKAEQAARAARSNQYLQRLIEDEQLRSNLMNAFDAARGAYARVSNGNGMHAGRALFEDRKLRKQVGEAIGALRDAGSALSEPPARSRGRKGRIGRMLLLAVAGGILAAVFSEGFRSKLLDMLFGSEEEFGYSSSTAPSTPAPEPVAG